MLIPCIRTSLRHTHSRRATGSPGHFPRSLRGRGRLGPGMSGSCGGSQKAQLPNLSLLSPTTQKNMKSASFRRLIQFLDMLVGASNHREYQQAVRGRGRIRSVNAAPTKRRKRNPQSTANVRRTVRFNGGRTTYEELTTGQLVRTWPPRPWQGKSERREVLRSRREDRMAAEQNEKGRP